MPLQACRGIANAVLLVRSIFPARDVNIENWSHCRLVEDLGVCPPPDMADSPPTEAGNHLAVPSPPTQNDLTPSSSPATSRRARHSSFSNPLPSINLELEGLERKVDFWTLPHSSSLLLFPSPLRWMVWWVLWRVKQSPKQLVKWQILSRKRTQQV